MRSFIPYQMSAVESGQESEGESVDLDTLNRASSRRFPMAEDLDSKNIQIGEANKLNGAANY